jgi:hypothetical protein
MSEQRTEKTPPKEGKSQEQRIADLELALAQTRAGTPLGTLPNHAGGVGQEVEETWSQYEQELATAGKHPDQPQPGPSGR